MSATEKNRLLAAVLAELEAELAALAKAQRSTQDGAVHEEMRAEGDKDMRATEAAYLARGQALRVAELENACLLLSRFECEEFGATRAIAAGALVTLASPRGRRRVLLLPAGAGVRVQSSTGSIGVITPASPIGSALLGRLQGDSIDVDLDDRTDEYDIERVE
ncbi:MAG: hypothetical protein R3B13_35810 [Polyangiaceae bacterium]